MPTRLSAAHACDGIAIESMKLLLHEGPKINVANTGSSTTSHLLTCAGNKLVQD